MKNILKYISVAFVGGLILASCEKSRPVVYTGEKFVAFEDTLIKVDESSTKEDANGSTQVIPTIVTVRINRGTGDISKDLVVSYSVKAKYVKEDDDGNEIELGDVPEGNFYLSSPSSVVIKAGEGFAFITITAVDNDILDGDKKITITLNSVSDNSYKLGYPGPNSKAKKIDVYLLDDECGLTDYIPSNFIGNRVATDVGLYGTDVYNVTISQGTTSNELVIGNFYNFPGFLSVPAQNVRVLVNPTNFQVTIPDQATGLASSTQGTLRVVGTTPGQITNLCRGEFFINYRMYFQITNNTYDQGTATYKK